MEEYLPGSTSHSISIRYTYFGYVWEDMQEYVFANSI